jgi:aerobic-type carbon monoxide dehydrogenase small subunit (CoxS/CutS family)
VAIEALKNKIDKLYKEKSEENLTECKVCGMPIKNVEVLVSNLIKEHYEWEEIKTVMGIIKKGKWEKLVNIIKDSIN